MASSSNSLAAAMQAFVDEDYASAEKHYSAALAAEPGGDDAELLAGRAAARLALEDFLGAADDARRAVAASPGLGKAHMRRGIALFHLDEFESSRDALDRAVELFQEQEGGGAAGKGGGSSGSGGSGSGASARKWLQRAEAALAAEGASGAAAAPAAASEKEEAEERAPPPAPQQQQQQQQPPPLPPPQQQQQQQPPPPLPPPPQQQPRFRHQWFQTGDAVEVGVLAKGLKSDAVRVEVEPRRLVVAVKGDGVDGGGGGGGKEEVTLLDFALAGEVVPEKCRHAVLSTKVEVRLHKAAPGLAWPSLEAKAAEGGREAAPAASAAAAAAPLLAPAPAAAAAAADWSSSSSAPKNKPSYPSSNPKHTNWDELDRKLEQEEKEDEEEGAEEGEEALLKLFRSVYSGGDDDVRRAMSKSFVESGGEVLSTSWRDVSAGRRPGEGDGDDDDDDEGLCGVEGCGGGASCGHRHGGHHH